MLNPLKPALFIAIGLLVVGSLAWVTKTATRVYLPTGWRLAPAGESTPVGDMLAGGEKSPNDKWIAFAAVGQGVHKVYIFDGKSGDLRDTADLGKGWIGLAWSPDSETLYVSGGTTDSVVTYAVDESGKFGQKGAIAIPDLPKNKGWLAGLALRGNELFVNVSANDKLLKLDVAQKQVIGSLDFEDGDSPYQVRLAANGHLFVSLQGSAKVAEVDPSTMKKVRTLETGRHPNDLLVRGNRLFVSCGNDDVVDVFDLETGAREERIVTRPWPDAPPGSTPNALAVSPDGRRIYVANSDNNAVGVVDISNPGHSHVEGFIPSGAYPSALATLADGRLLIGSSKGYGTGPNDKEDKIDPVAPKGYPYIVALLSGFVSKVDVSNPKELKEMTETVLEVSKYKPKMEDNPDQAPAKGSSAIPSKPGVPSPIKHVLYIIIENRTYDQVLVDLKKDGKQYGNGDPRLTLFGADTAPNHQQLAKEFVLFDNLYASGEVSVDGHEWSNGAYVPDFMQRTWPQQYSGKGTPRLTPELSAHPRGRIWEQMRDAGLSYRTYYYHTKDHMNEAWAGARKKGVRDYEAVNIFINEFKEMEQKGTVPNFMVMALSEDHTRGVTPGAFTPKACVASNDWGIGKIVEAISHSSLWKEFAIFIIEDDAQNGPDHVDAHRTVALAVSPYTRNAGIDSTMYTTTSVLRSIELILGAAPMSQFDAAATPMYKAFGNKPDLSPYSALRPAIDLMAKNPATKQSALLSSIDFSEPDQMNLAQEIALNRAIWHSVKGNSPYPGAVRRFGFGGPEMEEDEEGDDD